MNLMLVPDQELHRANMLLVFEIILSTIMDCKHLGEQNAKRFKTCGGNRSWNFDKTLKRNRNDMEEYLKDPLFDSLVQHANMENTDLAERLIIVMYGGHDVGIERIVQKIKSRRNRIHGQEKKQRA